MREILFKAKQKHINEWVYGNLEKNGDIFIIKNCKDCYRIEENTLGQYTGLTDKNGIKIFEGDTVKTKEFGKDDGRGHNFSGYDEFNITYTDGHFALENECRLFFLTKITAENLEVIGNIYNAENDEKEHCKSVHYKSGEIFNYNGMEFVILGEEQSGILAISSRLLEKNMSFDEDGKNDWRDCSLREYLNGEYSERFNKGDLLPFISDLTSDDGMKDYGTSEDYIGLLSCDLYRKYREYIPKYNNWWWTCTPWTCHPGYASHERIVTTDGSLYSHYGAYNGTGVAPACIFNLSIFE